MAFHLDGANSMCRRVQIRKVSSSLKSEHIFRVRHSSVRKRTLPIEVASCSLHQGKCGLDDHTEAMVSELPGLCPTPWALSTLTHGKPQSERGHCPVVHAARSIGKRETVDDETYDRQRRHVRKTLRSWRLLVGPASKLIRHPKRRSERLDAQPGDRHEVHGRSRAGRRAG